MRHKYAFILAIIGLISLVGCVSQAMGDINGSELVDNPWNTTFSPFTNFFQKVLGNGQVFFLIPISFIGVALYVKVREPVMVSLYLISTGILLASGNLFIGALEMSIIFTIVAVIGIAGLIISLFYKE